MSVMARLSSTRPTRLWTVSLGTATAVGILTSSLVARPPKGEVLECIEALADAVPCPLRRVTAAALGGARVLGQLQRAQHRSGQIVRALLEVIRALEQGADRRIGDDLRDAPAVRPDHGCAARHRLGQYHAER